MIARRPPRHPAVRLYWWLRAFYWWARADWAIGQHPDIRPARQLVWLRGLGRVAPAYLLGTLLGLSFQGRADEFWAFLSHILFNTRNPYP